MRDILHTLNDRLARYLFQISCERHYYTLIEIGNIAISFQWHDDDIPGWKWLKNVLSTRMLRFTKPKSLNCDTLRLTFSPVIHENPWGRRLLCVCVFNDIVWRVCIVIRFCICDQSKISVEVSARGPWRHVALDKIGIQWMQRACGFPPQWIHSLIAWKCTQSWISSFIPFILFDVEILNWKLQFECISISSNGSNGE